jgi:serine/threonine protein kinase
LIPSRFFVLECSQNTKSQPVILKRRRKSISMFRAGQQIGVYVLIGKLGKGGFGEVWLAEKRSQFITKKVAVKLPLDEQVNFDAIRQEATLWEQASGHPNVLPIIDADVYDGQVVIVSEYADGGSLFDRLKRDLKLSLQESVEMAIGILSGLDFLHSRRIIHRDIKPQNILLQGNTPRLADFGISRAMNTTVVSSAIIGTDAYMSPESFDGKRSVQTDIWSVGVVLYLLLKGRLPFPQEHPTERMFAVLTKDFEPLPPEIPADLRNIVQKALAKQPENRFQLAAEMREALQKALIGIAHPTLAKTEVFAKPDLSRYEANAPTITTADNQTQGTEVRTVVNNSPFGQTSPQSSSFPENPAPTHAAYAQNSVVTELKQTPTTENQPFSASKKTNSAEVKIYKRTRNWILLILGGAPLLVFAVFALGLSLSHLLKPKYPPELQKQIDEAKKKYPYYVYTDRIPFAVNKKYGFKNSKDEIKIPAKYDNANYFTEGLAPVSIGGKWGYIDEDGDVKILLAYDEAGNFSENLAAVKVNGKYRFINQKGYYAFSQEFDSAGFFTEGLAAVKSGENFGFIDHYGTTVIPFKYKLAYDFNEGAAAVCVNTSSSDNWGLIDKTGKELTPLKYDFMTYAAEGMFLVKLNNLYGFVDTSGRERVALKYSSYNTLFQDGYAEVERDGQRFRIDKDGRETYLGLSSNSNTSNTSNNNSMSNYSNSNRMANNANTYNKRRRT